MMCLFWLSELCQDHDQRKGFYKGRENTQCKMFIFWFCFLVNAKFITALTFMCMNKATLLHLHIMDRPVTCSNTLLLHVAVFMLVQLYVTGELWHGLVRLCERRVVTYNS